jgi:hypothetical protein
MSDQNGIGEEHIVPGEPKKEPDSFKRIFLVDFENVHIGGLKGIKHITQQDEIVLFYSAEHEESIAFIQELRSDIQYAKIAKNGQNALDFQLSSYLGYVIHKAVCEEELSRTRFVIISKDNGFDCVAQFWKSSPFIKRMKIEANISRAVSIEEAFSSSPKISVVQKTNKTEKQKIDEIMKKESSLTAFNNALCKEFGSEKAGVLYQKNKEQFKELHHV